MVIEVQERAEVFEGNRPLQLLLVEVPHFCPVQHPEFQAKPFEEFTVFVREELLDDELEGVTIHVLSPVLLDRPLPGIVGGTVC